MATSKLQRRLGNMLDATFPQFRITENYRPDWLISSDKTRLELDFYIHDLKIAFEVQGEQHFRFIPLFHKDDAGFRKRLQYDREKKDLCYGRGVRLIEVLTETDAIISVKELQERLSAESPDQPVYSYAYDNDPILFEEMKAEKERKQLEKKRKDTLAKERNKNGKANKVIEKADRLHTREELEKEFLIWRTAAMRKLKRGEPLRFEYIPHYAVLQDDIREFIESRLPLCKNFDDIYHLFKNTLESL